MRSTKVLHCAALCAAMALLAAFTHHGLLSVVALVPGLALMVTGYVPLFRAWRERRATHPIDLLLFVLDGPESEKERHDEE